MRRPGYLSPLPLVLVECDLEHLGVGDIKEIGPNLKNVAVFLVQFPNHSGILVSHHMVEAPEVRPFYMPR